MLSIDDEEAGPDGPAVLDCGHRVAAGSSPGDAVDCAGCDRRSIPEGYAPYRRTGEFTEGTVPRALTSRHTTKRGVWARIHVLDGRLRYRIHEPYGEEHVLDAATAGVVLPEVEHAVEPLGAVRFFVEFHGPEGRPPTR